VVLGSLGDLIAVQAEPQLAGRLVDPLDGSAGNDVMSLVEVMSVADDEIALTGCVACPRNLAGMPIGGLDLSGSPIEADFTADGIDGARE
jgi:hypothetical protein